MGDRLGLHIKTLQVDMNLNHKRSAHRFILQAIDWNAPKQGVNDYMELLVKETVTLHKVLSRYLSTAVVEVRLHHLSSTCVDFCLLRARV
jgi:hypothetical protein